jgi:hypothetical protein
MKSNEHGLCSIRVALPCRREKLPVACQENFDPAATLLTVCPGFSVRPTTENFAVPSGSIVPVKSA